MGRCKKTLGVTVAIVLLAVIVELATDDDGPGLGLDPYLVKLVMLALPGSAAAKAEQCSFLGGTMFQSPENTRGELQRRIASRWGFELAARAMRSHMDSPRVCEACAMFFCAMANFNRETSLRAGGTDAVPALVEAMRTHPYDARLQAQASASMGCWCDWTPETEEKVAALGGPQAVLKALKTFPGDAHVQYLGWAGLSSVSNRIPSKRIIIEAGAITTGIEIMRNPVLKKGYRVRQEIIMTFTNLAANCNECANDIMGTGDIIQQVTEAMEEEVPDAERGTKTDGIQLMMELARHNKTSRAAILEAGFLPHAIEGMRKFPQRHPQDAWPLVDFGLQLLASLAEGNPEAQAAMAEAGAVDVIKLVMQTEPGAPLRQEKGTMLLGMMKGR